jgi:Uma2 family endonuclease
MHTVRPDDSGQWTIDQLHRLPDDGNRYELVGGELFVTPAPSLGHQRISGLLFELLAGYVREHRIGIVVSAPNQLLLGEGKEEVDPDLMVIPGAEADLHGAWQDLPRPILIIEILSPTTRRRDLMAKRHLYVRERIPTYWIVDEETRSIRTVQPRREDVLATESLTWHPGGAPAPLVINVPHLFHEALGPVKSGS